MECGPSDDDRNKPGAGVGIAWNDKVEVVKEIIKTEELKKAWKIGRVDTYPVDLGWEESLRTYVIYGKSGGAK